MEMQLKQKTNTIAVAKELLTDAGFLTFWKGNGMNLIRVTPHKVGGILPKNSFLQPACCLSAGEALTTWQFPSDMNEVAQCRWLCCAGNEFLLL